MRLILFTVVVAFSIGLLSGGSLREFPAVRIRWTPVAVAGVVLQYVIVHGSLVFPMLLTSFACLLVFVGANLRAPGFALIMIGLALNATAIAANQGMPVTRHAIVASGQAGTIADLTRNTDEQKHVLASDGTLLLPLGDVIPIGAPIDQAVSVGDVFVHVGIGWFIVMALRKASALAVPEPAARS